MEVESLNQELKCKIRSANVLKRKATDKHTHSERETILDCLAAGLQASQIQSQWVGEPPDLDYIHSVINAERVRSRVNLPEYEALQSMCESAAGKRVMLCLIPDPQLDPSETPSELPFEALHLVMCCTLTMVDRLCECIGIGIDTKWRTCEGGKQMD